MSSEDKTMIKVGKEQTLGKTFEGVVSAALALVTVPKVH